MSELLKMYEDYLVSASEVVEFAMVQRNYTLFQALQVVGCSSLVELGALDNNRSVDLMGIEAFAKSVKLINDSVVFPPTPEMKCFVL